MADAGDETRLPVKLPRNDDDDDGRRLLLGICYSTTGELMSEDRKLDIVQLLYNISIH